MRRVHFLTVFILLLIAFSIQSAPASAAWEGTHRFSLAIEGSVTSIDQLKATTQSTPIEIRATLLITVDPKNASGEYSGRLYLLDAQTRQSGEMVPLAPIPSGYRIRLHTSEPPRLINQAPDLEAFGINVNELLTTLFPRHHDQPLGEGVSWTVNYPQSLQTNERALTVPIATTFRVNEMRDAVAIVQSTLRGSSSVSLYPGRLAADLLGSGVLHVDPLTGHLLRSAVTVRSTVEKLVPRGAGAPEESSQIRTLITTSTERIPDHAQTRLPSLGAEYVDPAQRFSLRLPAGWQTTPVMIDHSLTLFESPDQTERLFIDIAPSTQKLEPVSFARTMLDRYARFLVDFSILEQPAMSTLGGHTAALTEYKYRDGDEFTEGAFFTQMAGFDVAIQYSMAHDRYNIDGRPLLQSIGNSFSLGLHPAGNVSSDQLMLAPSMLYESDDLAFELEVPVLWPPIETADGSIQFAELGDAGRLSIHLESVAPDESALTLLQQWVRHMLAEQDGMEIITPVRSASLGPLPGASTTFRMSRKDHSLTQTIVVANSNGVLYVVSIDYDSDGFAERSTVFERILAGFRPLPEKARKHALTFDAYTPPPTPRDADPFLLIGRLLHEYSVANSLQTQPAHEIRVDVSVKGEPYTARTDSDGFFYLANLPVRAGDEIVVTSIRGRFFNLPYDVNIPIEGLTVIAHGPVGLFGEVTLALNEDHTSISLHTTSGVDENTGASMIHQLFLNRYPDSPWAQLVREDLVLRQGS